MGDPDDRVVLSVANSRSLARPRDPTILPKVACLIGGTVIDAYAAAVSVPDPGALSVTVALP